jgi:hypothetical protein
VIVDQGETQLITSLGWVEHGAFLVWNIASNEATKIVVADADHVSLFPGRADHFAVEHNRRHGGYAVSVRHMSAPDEVLATALVEGGVARLEGNPDAWDMVPRSYSGYDPVGGDGASYTLLLIEATAATCEVQRMEWFSADTYYLDYQGMGSPVQVPGEHVVLIPIQRSSQPVIYDVVSREVVGHLELSDRGGTPSLRFRTPNELWADDYDTILRLVRDGWKKRGELLLQPAGEGNVAQFIGGWAFDASGSMCVVGRPFSGDVLGIDAESFTVTKKAHLGGQPLDVAVLSDGRIFARSWQSGDQLRGELQSLDPRDTESG